MIEDKTPGTSVGMRTILLRMALGGVVGYCAAAGMLYLIKGPLGGLGKSETIAALVAVIYAVNGLAVSLGTASPSIGARFLNVEDAEELREQKKVLMLSGVSMVLWGIGLFALSLGAPGGPLAQTVALALGTGGLLIGTLLSIPAYRASDELMRAISLEAGALSFGLVMLIGGGWAMLAHLGYTAAPAPIDWLSLFYALILIASFIAVGRRGMLGPR